MNIRILRVRSNLHGASLLNGVRVYVRAEGTRGNIDLFIVRNLKDLVSFKTFMFPVSFQSSETVKLQSQRIPL